MNVLMPILLAIITMAVAFLMCLYIIITLEDDRGQRFYGKRKDSDDE